MIINIKDKDVELKFTFNSFRYMEDFDFSELDAVSTKPFKVIGIVESLLFGAVNNDPRVKFKLEDVTDYLTEFIEDGDIAELLENLLTLLEESSFFKNLQKKKSE